MYDLHCQQLQFQKIAVIHQTLRECFSWYNIPSQPLTFEEMSLVAGRYPSQPLFTNTKPLPGNNEEGATCEEDSANQTYSADKMPPTTSADSCSAQCVSAAMQDTSNDLEMVVLPAAESGVYCVSKACE